MNEKSIQEVIEIEKQAQDLLSAATREVERIPVQADLEAQALVKQARSKAQEEARKLLEAAHADDQVAQIQTATEARIREMEALSAKNLSKAVAFVLDRVMGKA